MIVKYLYKEGIINIYNHNDFQVIDGRELYSFFDLSRDFPTWIRAKIDSLDLIDGEDFLTETIYNGAKGRPAIEYTITIPTAVKIIESMRQNSDTLELLHYFSDTVPDLPIINQEENIIKGEMKMENKLMLIDNEMRINSVDLVDIINDFRQLESSTTDKSFKELKHYDFMKKIKKELDTLESLGLSAAGNISVGSYIDKQNQERPCYSLNRDGMLQMLNSESALVRYKTIEYINLLEDKLRLIENSPFNLPLTYKDALLQLVEKTEEMEQMAAENEELKAEQAINAPKVMAYEDFINSDGLYSFAATAKTIRIPRNPYTNTIIGRNTLLAWLRRDGILSKKGEDRNIPYQRYIDQGYFVLQAVDEEGTGKRMTVKVTPRGIDWLYKKYRYSNMPKKLEVSNIEEYKDDDNLNEEFLDSIV